MYIHVPMSEYLPLCYNAIMFRVWVMDMAALLLNSISTSDESEHRIRCKNCHGFPDILSPSSLPPSISIFNTIGVHLYACSYSQKSYTLTGPLLNKQTECTDTDKSVV